MLNYAKDTQWIWQNLTWSNSRHIVKGLYNSYTCLWLIDLKKNPNIPQELTIVYCTILYIVLHYTFTWKWGHLGPSSAHVLLFQTKRTCMQPWTTFRVILLYMYFLYKHDVYPRTTLSFALILPLYRWCFLLPWVFEVLLLSSEGKVSHDTNSLQSSCIKWTRSKFPAEALKDITQINWE